MTPTSRLWVKNPRRRSHHLPMHASCVRACMHTRSKVKAECTFAAHSSCCQYILRLSWKQGNVWTLYVLGKCQACSYGLRMSTWNMLHSRTLSRSFPLRFLSICWMLCYIYVHCFTYVYTYIYIYIYISVDICRSM